MLFSNIIKFEKCIYLLKASLFIKKNYLPSSKRHFLINFLFTDLKASFFNSFFIYLAQSVIF